MPHLPTPRSAKDFAATPYERRLLLSGALQLGVPVSETQLTQLGRYQSLLSEWGEKINLTALRNPTDVIVRHFLDCLALVRALPTPNEIAAAGLPTTLVDVGSGAGFPGVLCALLRPDLHVTLVERIGKKAAFLLALRRELGLSYQVEAASAERISRDYGIVVSRAALPLPEWLSLAAELAAPTGWIYAMTAANEAVPDASACASLTLHADIPYDVGAGAHRILRFRCG